MKQPDLGKKISQLRKEKNLSQEELTEKCHVSVRTIQRIESGEVTPRTSTIRILLGALEYQYDRLKTYEPLETGEISWFESVLLSKELPVNEMLKVLQMAWIGGIIYFVTGIVEAGLDYELYQNTSFDWPMKLFYSLIKLWVLVAYIFFARGFLALGLVFKNYLLRISAYLLIGVTVVITLVDILSVYFGQDQDTMLVVYGGVGMVAGVISIVFGIALIRLQDSMGKLSGYAGVIEMIMGVSFLLVIFFLIGFALMIPATILEIVLLYKGFEFLQKEVNH